MGDRPAIGITMDIKDGRFTLREEYVEAVKAAGGLPFLIPPAGLSYIEKIDGLLISGGDDLEPSYYGESAIEGLKLVSRQRSDFEITLVHEIIRAGKPLLGICYGMQLVNVALGGTLYQDIKSQVPKALNHKESHEVDIKDGWLLRAGTYTVNSAHHQAVKALGKGLDVLATSSDGLVEAVFMKDYPFLLCVQWHPERQNGFSDMIFNPFIEASYAGK